MKKLERIAEQLGFQQKMQNIQLLAIGPFKDIRLDFDECLQSFDRETMAKIERKWQEHLQERPNDLPGTLAHTLSIIEYNGILECRLQKTRFDLFIGTREPGKPRLLPRQKQWREEYSLPLSLSGLTITSDNALICGIRGKTGLESNLLTVLPAGYLNPEVHVSYPDYNRGKKTLSFLTLVIAELKEEIGLNWFEEAKILGVGQDCLGSQQPSIYVRLRVPLTSNEVWERAQVAGKEIKNFVFLNNDILAVRRVRESGFQWTGHDYPKLLLHFALP